MDIFSVILASLLALSLGYFLVMMIYRIRNNVLTGVRFNEALARELGRLRISRMLQALGISQEQFTHQQSVVDIHRYMRNCEACENTEACDDKLAQGEVRPEDIEFCNNAETLRAMRAAGDS